MAKVLVTGANGFVGQHLVKELADNRLSVVAVGGPQRAAGSSKYVTKYLTLDLTKPEDAQKIDFSEVDGVVHLAGLAAVGPSFDHPLDYFMTNVGIETNLFEIALVQEAFPRFLIVSSGSLYDQKAPLPLDESSAVIPNSPYAVSKLGQEQMGQYYGQRGFEIIIARPFNHIGPGQNPGFLVADLAKQVVEFEKGLAKEVLVGNLDAKRDYTDVRDIVRAYRLLLGSGMPGETYNICSGTPRSGHEVLEQLVKSAGGGAPKITQDPAKMRPSDASLIYGSHQKITGQIGWQPQIPIEQTSAAVIEDWRSRT